LQAPAISLAPEVRLGEPVMSLSRYALHVPRLPNVEEQIARTAMLQLPLQAPAISLAPEVRLGEPVMSLSRYALHVGLPQVALAAPALRLPATPPLVAGPRASPTPAALPASPPPPALGVATAE